MRGARAAIGICALMTMGVLAGCETRTQVVSQKEDLLAAAGFEAHPADTPQRLAMLGRLPPDHFVTRDIHGRTVYLYGDPIACNCVYFGSAEAYGRYRQERFQQRLADEAQQTAEDQQMAAQSFMDPGWDFGPWGNGLEGGGFWTGY